MKRRPCLIKDESGSVTAVTVISLIAFLGVLALVVDLGHLHTVQNEIQNAADAAALAGARAIYPMTAPPWILEGEYAYPQYQTKILPAAMDAAYQNRADHQNLSVKVEEVVPGWWDYRVPPTFNAFTKSACTSYADTNAVMVTTRMRGDLSQGSVIMTFAKIFGYDTVDLKAYAIAAMGYLNFLPKNSPGGFIAPNVNFMDYIWNKYGPYDPDNPKKFYLIIGAAGGQVNWEFADNAGWSAPVGTNPTPNFLKDVINNGTPIDMTAGQTEVALSNGEKTPAIVEIKNHCPPGLDITVPTVDTDMYNQTETIQSFYDVHISNAWKPGDKLPEELLANLREVTDANGRVINAVGIIEFELLDQRAVQGTGGPFPSNVYAIYPKLVYTDSNSK
jgi:hypothetical protein